MRQSEALAFLRSMIVRTKSQWLLAAHLGMSDRQLRRYLSQRMPIPTVVILALEALDLKGVLT